MLIIGVDPGGITRKNKDAHAGTGISVLEFTDKIVIHEARQVLWDEWTLSGMLENYVAEYSPDKVVYEDFIPRRGVPFSLDPVKLIGAIKATVEPDLLAAVSPSAHKSLIKRDWAKQLVLCGEYLLEDSHKVDSTSLCLYYGITRQNKTVLEGLKTWLSKS